MASKAPVKKRVAAAAVKPKSVSKPRAAKTSSRGTAVKAAPLHNFWKRTPFLFYSILIAAGLVALSLGLMTYQNKKTANSSSVVASDTTGVLFLQSLESKKSYQAGETLDVTIYEDSGKQKVNALQAAVQYPSEKLELVNVKSDSSFTQEAATDTATAGLIRLARSIKPGEASLQGAKPVATLQFKVIADSPEGVEFSIDNGASLLVRSSDNKNILGANATNKFNL